MEKPSKIFKYYKFNSENLDTLQSSYIYLSSARRWKDQGDFKLDIVIGNDNEYKSFLQAQLEEGYSLTPEDAEYETFLINRGMLLEKFGLTALIGSQQEKDFLVNKLFEESTSKAGRKKRTADVRENMFQRTGICCFTADANTLELHNHWDVFADLGSGFCVEYNWQIMQDYFRDSNAGIDGRYINYYKENVPQIKAKKKRSTEGEQEVYQILFSLPQILSDEKEFRVVKAYRTKLSDESPARKMSIPKDALTSITLGPKLLDSSLEALKASAKRLGSTIYWFKISTGAGEYSRKEMKV